MSNVTPVWVETSIPSPRIVSTKLSVSLAAGKWRSCSAALKKRGRSARRSASMPTPSVRRSSGSSTRG